MAILRVTCVEKNILMDKKFHFDFPCIYKEYHQLSQQEFYQKVYDQDVLVVNDLVVDEIVLDHNPTLKLVALCSTGFDHINIPLLRQHGVKVANIRGYAGDAVAEHAFMLMINLFKNMNSQLNSVLTGKWSHSPTSYCLSASIRELNNKNLVILGKGEIGLSLAKKAKAFGMHVYFSERKNALTCRQGYIPFNQAIKIADVLSLHCELNNHTKGMIDLEVIQQMKSSSILINAGRGGLIDEYSLVHALKNNYIAGFGADVLSAEPPPTDHILLNFQHPNVMITPHIAWATDEAQGRLFDILQKNINSNIHGIAKNLIN